MSDVVKNCNICRLSDENDFEYGEWKTSGDVKIHLFCALLSADLPQRGEDNEGIDGFLIEDIKNYEKLRAKKVCYHCKRNYASVKCAKKGCQRWWHVVCSVKNKCLSIFEDEFKSYCHKHVPRVTEKYAIHQDWWKCQICRDPMGEYDPITSIPSCCNQGYFHRKCVQEHAISAGYLTKCPCCGNDPDGYRKFLRNRGVFCPDKDADWELQKDAFQSLLVVFKKCDSSLSCRCPKGIEHSSSRRDSRWFLLKCKYCGEHGIHRGCREAEAQNEEQFICEDCEVKETQSMSQNEAPVEFSNTNPELQPSTSRDGIGGDDDVKRERAAEVMNDNAGKKLKLVATSKLESRDFVLDSVDPTEEEHVDPLCDEKRAKMRNSRLDMFFTTADFSFKPQMPSWVV